MKTSLGFLHRMDQHSFILPHHVPNHSITPLTVLFFFLIYLLSLVENSLRGIRFIYFQNYFVLGTQQVISKYQLNEDIKKHSGFNFLEIPIYFQITSQYDLQLKNFFNFIKCHCNKSLSSGFLNEELFTKPNALQKWPEMITEFHCPSHSKNSK